MWLMSVELDLQTTRSLCVPSHACSGFQPRKHLKMTVGQRVRLAFSPGAYGAKAPDTPMRRIALPKMSAAPLLRSGPETKPTPLPSKQYQLCPADLWDPVNESRKDLQESSNFPGRRLPGPWNEQAEEDKHVFTLECPTPPF